MLNRCLYLRQRHNKGQLYYYCTNCQKKGIIKPNECYKCELKEYKQYKKMENKTTKAKKLEEKRYSILTNNLNICYVCKERPKDDIHEIYAGRNRITSIKNGFCIPICRKCHSEIQNDEEKMLIYKKECQLKYEENHTREDFINLIGRNYL